jgi:hypothetical protein
VSDPGTFVTDRAGWALDAQLAQSINRRDWIVGSARCTGGQWAVLLTPTREPAADADDDD